VVEISGPAYYSSSDVAAALAKALERPITGVAVPRPTWVEAMAQNGIPADRSGSYIEMLDSFNSGWIAFGVPGTEHIKGSTDLLTAVRAMVAQSN
jgi:NAD(P)H dehydrogenase (quinone)